MIFFFIVLLIFLQVFCVSNFFEQPVDPVVSQEEEASHTSLQENPPNGNHYGSTEWIKDDTLEAPRTLQWSRRT